MTTVTVMGAGAIGCFVGGKLRAAGHKVAFLGRPRAVDTLSRNGLKLTQFDGPDTNIAPTDLSVSADEAILGEGDVILVCVKSQDTEQAAQTIARHAKPKATIVSLQNGVSNARVLGQHLGVRPIAAGCVQFNVVVNGNGHFHRATEGGIIIKETPVTQTFSRELSASGIEATVHSDMQAILWSKLLLNLNNGLNALADVPIVDELSDRSYRIVLATLIDEALAALRAAHIKPTVIGKVRPLAIPYVLRLPTFAFKRVASAMLAIDPHARSSMWEDLRAKRSSEIDYLNGAVVALAHETGTPVPANETIIQLVHEAFASGKSPALSGKELREMVRNRSSQ